MAIPHAAVVVDNCGQTVRAASWSEVERLIASRFNCHDASPTLPGHVALDGFVRLAGPVDDLGPLLAEAMADKAPKKLRQKAAACRIHRRQAGSPDPYHVGRPGDRRPLWVRGGSAWALVELCRLAALVE